VEEHNNISQELFETIERYLTRSMDASENDLFEKRMASDFELQQQVNDLRLILSGVETAVLKEKMEDFHKEVPLTHSKVTARPNRIQNPKKSKYSIYAIAAAFIGLFGVFYFMNSETSSDKLFAKHFIPDPGLPTTMSTNTNFEFFDAMVNYKREEYAIAITKWEKLSEVKIKNDTLNYYLGVSYLAQGNSEKALHYLEGLAQFEKSIFSEDAVYYRALALIKEGKLQEAENLMEAHPSEKNNKLLSDIKQ
jgi:tetratricopeptide (TPR) repeat protein